MPTRRDSEGRAVAVGEGRMDEESRDLEAPEEEIPAGYSWPFATQERDLPEEYPLHMAILDEMEPEEIDQLDLSRCSDYILWAAAQAREELDDRDEAIALLERIAASENEHPALDYTDILLRLQELLVDRGDYAEALALLERVELHDPESREACRERRAEILILSGRDEEGLRLIADAARGSPEDPWIPMVASRALMQRGDYERALEWVDRSARAARRLRNEEEARQAASEIDELRREAEARAARREKSRRARTAPADDPDLEMLRQAILVDLDTEEARLVRNPPREAAERKEAGDRLAALHARASRAWDDAVEAGREELIATLDDLQWAVVEVAERFGISLPGIED